ncbi:helix-turn-helix domain-containing protein [Actinacidiphila sp. DG2A-62]|uniref:helix-turn-helix domain-containing protein n=1 Tax=Actinacidiphila sp. DG2A-62 TaxID=3108821 RepID=UPI002DBC95B4|nr:helix-turn-helix domain-containing protein [Actinacidiphila sp. DG2A-62]MEC3998250.1 helix-turn-helix domain-containing protein [Actinacidiphila sp. DG2A-62]
MTYRGDGSAAGGGRDEGGAGTDAGAAGASGARARVEASGARARVEASGARARVAAPGVRPRPRAAADDTDAADATETAHRADAARADVSRAGGAGTARVPAQGGEARRTARPGSSVSAMRLGRRLRMSRRRLGLTLDAVSGRTGLSKSFLSQVEAGRANPTLESLHRLAEAVETPLSVLLAGPGPAGGGGAGRAPAALALGTTYRPARDCGRWAAGEGRTYPLTAPGARRFETVLVEGTAAHHALATSHPGEELCHVLAGRLRAEVDGERFALAAGDSLHYDSALAHRLTALAAGTRFLLQVAGPPVA